MAIQTGKRCFMNAEKISRYRSSEAVLFNQYKLSPVEHFIYIEKYNIQIRVLTAGKGQPVLFIHGAPNAGSTWAQLVSFMPDFTCVMIDRPECGLSDTLQYDLKSVDDVTDMIVTLIESVLNYFNYEEISIVASSLGGYLSMLYVLKRNGKVKKLILEGCPALVEEMNIPTFLKWLIAPVIRWIAPNIPTSKSFLKRILIEMGHGYSVYNDLMPEVFVQWYVCLFNMTNTQKNDIALISQLMQGGETNAQFLLKDSEIIKIKQPTLWLWGEEDPFGGKEIGERINGKMINSRFIFFENSGHLPWLDNPSIHANKMREFLMADLKI